MSNSSTAGKEKAPCVVGATQEAKFSGKILIRAVLPWAPYCLLGLCCVLASLGGLTYE
jgi:hypothetical protein